MKKYFCYLADVLTLSRLLMGVAIALLAFARVPASTRLYSLVLSLFLLGLATDALDGILARKWPYSEETERSLFWRKNPVVLDAAVDDCLFYATFFLLVLTEPSLECFWVLIASFTVGICSLFFDKIRSKNVKAVLKTAYLYLYISQLIAMVWVLTILAGWPMYVYGFYGVTGATLLVLKRNRLKPWNEYDLMKGVKRVMILVILMAFMVVGVVLHQLAGRPIELQTLDLGGNARGEILYICIPGTAPCNAYPFNAIRDRVLINTGDVLYIKYPEKWFSFEKSVTRMTQILENYSMSYKEIRIIAGSLGAKIAVGAEAQMGIITGCKVTNYLVSPSFGPGDVRWIEMFRSGFGSNRKVELDPEMDALSQELVNKDVKEHTLMYMSQLLASLEGVNSRIDSRVYSFIIESEGDWLTNTDKAVAKFEKKISSNFDVVSLPLRTHCEYLKEAHIYCAYFEEAFSK